MKKIKGIAALVMAVILLLSLAACSGEKPASSSSPSSDSASSAEKSDSGSNAVLPTFDETYTIEETHLTDTYDVSITATELAYDYGKASLKLKIENKSDAKRKVLAGTSGYGCNAVNGYMVTGGYLNCEVEPGATAEDEISFSYNELYALGINVIADIGVGFDVEDENNNDERSGMITVKTKKADDYDYAEDTYVKMLKSGALKNAYDLTVESISENASYSEGGVSMLSQAVTKNKDGARHLMLEFESKSDQDLYVSLSGLSVNGQEVKSSFLASDLICSGKRAVLSVSLSDFDKQNSGQAIKSAEVSVALSNTDSKVVAQKQSVAMEF